MMLPKWFAGIAMFACVFVSGHAQTQATQQVVPGITSQSISGEDASAKLTSEVRLRKLHLVRPDLIGYPIVYEIYC